jgi:hypothetical protein
MKLLSFIIFILTICGCSHPIPPANTIKNTPIDTTDTTSDGNKIIRIGFEPMDSEKIGEIRIGMAMESVINKLGQPGEKTDTAISPVDGLLCQEWRYKKHGIFLWMEGKKSSKMYVESITINAPCDFKTNRRIGIGSSSQDIKSAYHQDMDIAKNTVYGGMLATIHNNKIDTITVAGAEKE